MPRRFPSWQHKMKFSYKKSEIKFSIESCLLPHLALPELHRYFAYNCSTPSPSGRGTFMTLLKNIKFIPVVAKTNISWTETQRQQFKFMKLRNKCKMTLFTGRFTLG